MRKPLVVGLCALALAGLGATPAVAVEPTPTGSVTGGEPGTLSGAVHDVVTSATASVSRLTAPKAQAVSFAGTVALSNCSGSVVRFPDSEDNDPALVMSNGHCLESGFPEPGKVIVDQASSRTFSLLNSAGSRVATLRASKIAYATMTDTDVSMYQLTTTYGAIKSSYGIDPLTISEARPAAGTAITVVSGYWKRTYACDIDGFAHRLKEGGWTWKDSVRYTDSCDIIGGTSGSPVVDNATGQVVAVNNTLNEDGARCTVNNPCEVAENGTVTVHTGIGYGQQTYQMAPCFGVDNKLDLSASGCTLPKP
ncbi:serine protease [Streptomyces sp. DG2A-72]|uniref:S1 family peptidase n=1 Tax=Streptomyces sp. DG2A-72 TaxID=3051386 RepID=UPI00265C56AA|nr:serine protease [Streptomyces sp. DG2A-72]MDO0935959.1 serine protease [Streptomyces sp. DG2A-72]